MTEFKQGENIVIKVMFADVDFTNVDITSIRAYLVIKDNYTKFADKVLEPTIGSTYGEINKDVNFIELVVTSEISRILPVGEGFVTVATVTSTDKKEYLTGFPVVRVLKGYVLKEELY